MQQIRHTLIPGLDFLAILGNGYAAHFGVGGLVGENKGAFTDVFGDSGVQSFQLTERLMDGHSFTGHKLYSFSFDFYRLHRGIHSFF